jgi:hypothetical protein
MICQKIHSDVVGGRGHGSIGEGDDNAATGQHSTVGNYLVREWPGTTLSYGE